jgi:hypothetical protein
MKILVYDPFSGISGDMHMGAMVDLGVPQEYLLESLEALSLEGWSVRFQKDRRSGMTGTRAIVEIKGEEDSHGHTHVHRGLEDIRRIVEESSLTEKVKERSMRMFQLIAEAEAHVHGTDIEKVLFHEVGAVDSILDIVAAAAAIEYLEPDRILSFPPELGGGFVRCAHGLIPVPAPATARILEGLPTLRGAVQKETTTPTGAAILKANVDEFIERASFRVTSTGYGAGSRELRIPNLLRVYLAEEKRETAGDLSIRPPIVSKGSLQRSSPVPPDAVEIDAVMLECNIDDMNPELYDHALKRLYQAGVKEAYITPVQMKKNRPGTVLTVMSVPDELERVKMIMFQETTTAGIREYPVRQTMLERSFETVHTPYGAVRVKKLYYNGRCISKKPEYEEVRALAESQGIPLREIYRSIER